MGMNIDSKIAEFGWTKAGWYPLGPYFCLTTLLMCHSMHVMTGPLESWEPDDISCTDVGWNNSQGHCVNTMRNGTELNCQSWSFGNLSRDLTMVRDFSLVCDDEYLVSLINSLYVGGVFLGNIFLGSLPDQFGRKTVCLVTNWVLGLLALFIAVANDIFLILILRFVSGIFYSMTQFTTWMWIPELFSSKNRYVPVQFCHFGWSSGLLAVAGLSYSLPNWRHLNVAVAAVCLSTIPYTFLIPESLYWLVRNEMVKQTEDILSALKDRVFLIGLHGNVPICRRSFSSSSMLTSSSSSPRKLDEAPLEALKTEEGKAEPVVDDDEITVRLVGTTPTKPSTEAKGDEVDLNENDDNAAALRRPIVGAEKKSKTFWICFSIINAFWFIDGLVYYALQFSAQQFAGDRILNFFLFSVVEFPATCFAFLLGHFTTRRFSLLFLHALFGAALLVTGALRSSGALDDAEEAFRNAVLNGFNIAGKCFVTGCFSIFVFYPAEVFPTNIRNTAFNINASFSRVAAFVATFASFAFKRNAAVVELVFGVSGLLICLTVLALPESKNQPLPQTMKDLDEMKAKTGSVFKVA